MNKLTALKSSVKRNRHFVFQLLRYNISEEKRTGDQKYSFSDFKRDFSAIKVDNNTRFLIITINKYLLTRERYYDIVFSVERKKNRNENWVRDFKVLR